MRYYYVWFFISLAGAVFGLTNGIYAIASPARWLRARWSAKGLLPSDTSQGTVRIRALFFFMVAAAFAVGAYRALSFLICLR